MQTKMCDENVYDSILIAKAPAREQLRRDREVLPKRFWPLLVYLEEHLFDTSLTLVAARRNSGVRDTAISNQFKAHHGLALWQYILQLRLETAARLLSDSDETVGRIADWVGFGSYSNFHRAYVAWAGETPSETRKRQVDTPVVDFAVLRRAVNRQLSNDEARRLIELLCTLYPAAGLASPRTATPVPLSRVDGASFEQFRAEREVWPALVGKSFGEQKQVVAGCAFVTSALFDFLRQKSREEGRKDRSLGIELAQLALFSLDVSADHLGPKVQDLRALGWAWLANARRLALDFLGAEADIERAYVAWEVSQPIADVQVLAEVLSVDALLKRCQHRFEESQALSNRAIPVLRLQEDPERIVRALLVRSATLSYLGNADEGIADLEASAALLQDQVSFLSLAVWANLAGSHALAGNLKGALEALPKAKRLSASVGSRLIGYQLSVTEGLLERAQGLWEAAELNFRIAMAGFAELGEPVHSGIVALELGILIYERNRHEELSELILPTRTVFQDLSALPESTVALHLLGRAQRDGEWTLGRLEKLKDCMAASI